MQEIINMIVSSTLRNMSPIILSVLLIAYLMLFELGNKKIKRAIFPFVVVLLIIFVIIAVLNIIEVYSGIK